MGGPPHGEFLVGEYIEQNYPELNVWIPSKDTGIDLLVTNKNNTSSISLQVKLSRDYKQAEAATNFERCLLAGGWLMLDQCKLAKSTADYWVIVLVSHERKIKPQFIVITPEDLSNRLKIINNKEIGDQKDNKKPIKYHLYPLVTKSGIALDGRGLKKAEKDALATGTLPLGKRNLSEYLNDKGWEKLIDKGFKTKPA